VRRASSDIFSLAPLSMLILGLNIILYIVSALRSGGLDQISGIVLIEMGGSMREGLWEGEWVRLIAPTFLHVNVLHILINTITLRSIAPPAEVYFGSSNFGTLYLISGIAGFALSQIFGGHLAAGASASLFGILGAELCVRVLKVPKLKHAWRSAEVRQFFFWAMLYLALGLTGLMGPVDNYAHLGGFLAGALMAGLFEIWRNQKRVSIALLLSVFILVAAVVAAARWTIFSPYYHIHKAVLARAESKSADVTASYKEARAWAAKRGMVNATENFITLIENERWNHTLAWQHSGYEEYGKYLGRFPPVLYKHAILREIKVLKSQGD